MADKNLSFKFKGDSRSLVSAITGIQAHLHGAQIATEKFMKEQVKMTAALRRTARDVKKGAESTKKMEKQLDEMGKAALEAEGKIEKFNKQIKSTSKVNFGSSIGKGFKTMGNDIMRATKLLGTFATVAGGIQLHIAKEEYLDYSKEIMRMRNTIDPSNRLGTNEALSSAMNTAAINSAMKPSDFLAQFQGIISGSIPVNINENTSKEDAMKQIADAASAFERISLFGQAHGATAEESAEAVARFGAATRLDPDSIRDPAELEKILGYIGVLLDESAGGLSEISTTLGRVMTTGLAVEGATIDGVLALFARQTKLKSVMLAGRHTAALNRALGSGIRESQSTGTKVKSVLTTKKDSEGNLVPFFAGSKEETATARKFLRGFDSTAEVNKKIFRVDDGEGGTKKANSEEILRNYLKFMQQAKTAGIGSSSFLEMIQGKQEVRTVINDAFDAIGDIDRIKGNFGTLEERNAKVLQKEANVKGTFAFNYDQAKGAYADFTNQAFEKISPSLNTVAQTLTTMLRGGEVDMMALNKTFDENIANLEKTSPILAEVAKSMKEFSGYAATGGLKEDLVAIGSTIVTIGKGIKAMISGFDAVFNSAPVRGLRNMLGGGAGADFLVAVGGMSLAKQLGGLAIGGKLGTSIGGMFNKTAGKGVGSMIGKGMMALNWAPFALAIGAMIGNQVAKDSDEKFNKTNFKGTKAGTKAGTDIIKFNTLNLAQDKLILKGIARANPNTELGASAQSQLDSPGLMSDELFNAFQKRKNRIKKGITLNAGLDFFGDDLHAFGAGEKQQLSTGIFGSNYDSFINNGAELSDSNNATAIFDFLSNKNQETVQKQTLDINEKLQIQTDSLILKLDEVIQSNIMKGNTQAGFSRGPLAPTGSLLFN